MTKKREKKIARKPQIKRREKKEKRWKRQRITGAVSTIGAMEVGFVVRGAPSPSSDCSAEFRRGERDEENGREREREKRERKRREREREERECVCLARQQNLRLMKNEF